MKQKVLIVKLGFLETIDNRVNFDNDKVSLGDVFRTTAILHLFKNDRVSWLATKDSMALLVDNPYIERILSFDLTTILQLQAEYFDVIINLERVPGICALTDSIKAWKRYGFRFDARKGRVEAYEHSYEAIANSDNPNLRKKMKEHWIELLYKMMGAKWRGEGYILGYRPRTKVKCDIGFNSDVSKRWGNKSWPKGHWKRLEDIIGNRYSVSYQQSLNDIYGYIDWLNSCRLVITNDSLGLHLAIALRKKIIALFGPTSDKEVYLFNRGIVLKPNVRLNCIPCFRMKCKFDKNCIDFILPETVYGNIEQLLNE